MYYSSTNHIHWVALSFCCHVSWLALIYPALTFFFSYVPSRFSLKLKHTHTHRSTVRFLGILCTTHCSCLTTAKKLALFGMIHHLSIDWLLRRWIQGACAEHWNPAVSVKSNGFGLTHTRTLSFTHVEEMYLHCQANPGWQFRRVFQKSRPRCWWINL